jgi:hypothetical protein
VVLNVKSKNLAYDQLLAEAIKIGKQHSAKAKYFVPKMYEVLVETERLKPKDAAQKIYDDLAQVWQKDTIRRLLPPEVKDPVARQKQARSRLQMISNSGLILQSEQGFDPDKIATIRLENVELKKKIQELQEENQLLQEKISRLEKPQPPRRGDRSKEMTIVLTPHLFLKTFTLMRSSTKPLVMKVAGTEVVDVDKMKL